MKKQLILASFLALAGMVKAQWFPSSGLTQDIYRTGKVSINTSPGGMELEIGLSQPDGGIGITSPASGSGSQGSGPTISLYNGNAHCFSFQSLGSSSTGNVNSNHPRFGNFAITDNTDNEPRLEIQAGSGNVGIGTTNPNSKLTIAAASGSGYAFTINNSSGVAVNAVRNDGRVAIGNTTGPDYAKLNVNCNNSAYAIDVFNSTQPGITADQVVFRVKSNGWVFAREITVQLAAFPDYVFKSDYKLMPLKNLESFIKLNKHLPNVPAAEEIAKDGGNLGELVRIQMEKTEELTLYILELNKKIEVLQEENKKLSHK